MSFKLLVADDHPVVREGIRDLATASGIEVVGQVDSSDKIVESVTKLKPFVLITEVRMGGRDALKHVEKLENGCRVVVFSAYSNPTNIARASALGCHDFIVKTSSCESLIQSVQGAANGDATPENSLLRTVKARMLRGSFDDSAKGPLTDRETQVIRHVSMGLSNREIGKSLGISIETVKEHVQNILRKLDVNDRTQAAIWAINNGLI
jgi:DNA-binding NarL/FixJ family response regulator